MKKELTMERSGVTGGFDSSARFENRRSTPLHQHLVSRTAFAVMPLGIYSD